MNEISQPQVPTSASISPTLSPPGFPVGMVILSFVAGISLSAAIFFGYQYFQLKDQVIPTTSPSITNDVVEDQDDLMIYSDPTHLFSFQYPSSAQIAQKDKLLNLDLDGVTLIINPDGAHQWGEGMSQQQINSLYIKSFQYPDSSTFAEKQLYPDSAVNAYIMFASPAEKQSHQKTLDQFDQILSTFTFTKTDNSLHTYTNKDLGFSFIYPSPIVEGRYMGSQYNKMVDIKSTGLDLQVMLKKVANSATSLDKYYYLDQTPTSRTTLAGQPANVYIKTGTACYSHGETCPEYVAVVTKHNDDYWHLIFNNTTELTTAQNQVLNTFKFEITR